MWVFQFCKLLQSQLGSSHKYREGFFLHKELASERERQQERCLPQLSRHYIKLECFNLKVTYPLLPLRTALTVSLTPRWTSLSFIPFLINLISFLLILSLARGSAIGLTKSLLSAIFNFINDYDYQKLNLLFQFRRKWWKC